MTTIDILIPVLARPQNVQTTIESIESATSNSHRILFIATEGDDEEIEALKKAKADYLIHPGRAGRADFARKINWAFWQTDSPWIFQGADDLRFHWNWDVYAIRLADRRKVSVIGTQDLGNPLVKRGGHSTHTLFRRDYIERYGGTYDDTGIVFCELYDHQYCDNEFVQTAIRRGEWAFSKRSIVEHMHHAWGKADKDETYEKAIRETRADNRLFVSRMRLRDRIERKEQRQQMLLERRERRERGRSK